MDQIKGIVDWIRTIPGGDIGIIIASIVTIASIIVKWTPTPKDDEFLGKIKNFIGKWIALNPDK